MAVVEENFRLNSEGRFAAACVLESEAYLRFDAQHYTGGCEAGSRAVAEALTSQGISMQLTSTKVMSYAEDQATILVKLTLGAREVTEHIYTHYRAGKWWISGADDSGDLGF